LQRLMMPLPETVTYAIHNSAPSPRGVDASSTPLDYDLAIVGGGIVGLTLAAALKHSGLRVAIIEAQPQSEAIAKGQAYAIHLSSQRIWQHIGVWPLIHSDVQPFRQVLLSDAHSPHVVTFAPSDLLHAEALGYVAEHRVLLKALQRFVGGCSTLDWYCPAFITAQRECKDCIELDVQSVDALVDTSPIDSSSVQTLRVGLLVGADGSKSPVRQRTKIQTRGKAYWQSCVVATIQTEKHHHCNAYERFWPTGPFAILPVSDTCCRIVWTVPHREAEAILALDDIAFIQQLTERFGTQMGRLTVVGPRFSFPAKLMHACQYVRSRIALVGDAAHSCHPVGGQGLNLGIRDVGVLAQVLCQAQARGEDIGQLSVLRQYERWRRWQNVLALGFTDLLNLTFSNNIWPLVTLRRLGLWAMGHLPSLRVATLRFMSGLSGKMPFLAQDKLHH
jgi:2-octaprenyl-6-methoxyphenol hydroxylase